MLGGMSWEMSDTTDVLSADTTDVLSADTLASVGGHPTRNGFGRFLQHMAPFGIPTTGFCMVFQCATSICSALRLIFGPRDLDLGSGCVGDCFFLKNGATKNMGLW